MSPLQDQFNARRYQRAVGGGSPFPGVLGVEVLWELHCSGFRVKGGGGIQSPCFFQCFDSCSPPIRTGLSRGMGRVPQKLPGCVVLAVLPQHGSFVYPHN